MIESQEAFGALARIIEVAFQLNIYHPEIADFYRDGKTQPEIAKLLNVQDIYQLSDEDTARKCIQVALHGNNYNKFGQVFIGLIPSEELELLKKEHVNLASKRNRESGIMGYLPWTEGEHILARALRHADYKYREAAQFINENYHNGKEIRTGNSLKISASRRRKAA